MPEISTKFSTDKSVVELHLTDPRGQKFILPFDAENIDLLVRNLTQIRSEMLPSPQTDSPSTVPVRLEAGQIDIGWDDASGLPSIALALPQNKRALVVLTPESARGIGTALIGLADEAAAKRAN